MGQHRPTYILVTLPGARKFEAEARGQLRIVTLSTLPKVAFVGGILLSALLAFTVYSAGNARRLHAREAIAAE